MIASCIANELFRGRSAGKRAWNSRVRGCQRAAAQIMVFCMVYGQRQKVPQRGAFSEAMRRRRDRPARRQKGEEPSDHAPVWVVFQDQEPLPTREND